MCLLCSLQLLRDEIGFSPLHHACRLESIALARVLIEAESGKRALLLHNNSDQKPIELCSSNFMKLRIEGTVPRAVLVVLVLLKLLELFICRGDAEAEDLCKAPGVHP
jgi:hypothetical protein